MATPVRVAAACALAFCFAAGARAATWADVEVAREGQPCPGNAGATFVDFLDTRLLDGGSLVFYAQCRLPSSATPFGLFAQEGGVLHKLVFSLDPAPGLPGAFFIAIEGPTQDVPAVNENGGFAFRAMTSTPASHGLFLGSPAGIQTVVRSGDPLPAPLSGTFHLFFEGMDLNDAGVLVFGATYFAADILHNGLFRFAEGQLSVVAAEGQPVPGEPGAVWAGFGAPTLNASGDVAFLAHVDGGAGGVALWSDGAVQLLVREGDVAPGTGGGIYVSFNHRVAIDDSGGIVFLSPVGGGIEGVFRYADGEVTPIVLENDPVPMPDAIVGGLRFQPSVSRSGRVVMPANIESPAFDVNGFLAHDGSAVHVVRLEGDPAPGDGHHTEFPTQPSIDSSGRVSFTSELEDGTERVFVATLAPEVPAVPPAAWLAAAAALLLTGLSRARRLRARA